MKTRSVLVTRIVSILLTALASLTSIIAQSRPAKPPPPPVEESFLSAYGMYLGIIVVIGLVIAVVRIRKKAAADAAAPAVTPEGDGFRLTFRGKDQEKQSKRKAKEAKPESDELKPTPVPAAPAQLPVYSFVRLQRTNAFLQLPQSNDPDLLEAIRLTDEESEEDAQVRANALKLLATYKNTNSIVAISQIALYDLSAKLRSEAVGVLAEMDHESVFETLVTACADPTREVRASAARALFKVNFDRAHAWTRVIESGDISRMRHVARSAVEGDLVMRSLDRLVHPDKKVAYEAFALTALLMRAGEPEPVFKTLAEHRDDNVKMALLHVLQTIKAEGTVEHLNDLMSKVPLSSKVAEKVNEVRACLQMATV